MLEPDEPDGWVEDMAQLVRVDEEQLLMDFKNLYWTRLISIENFEADQER